LMVDHDLNDFPSYNGKCEVSTVFKQTPYTL
jgi:hypothetical protein